MNQCFEFIMVFNDFKLTLIINYFIFYFTNQIKNKLNLDLITLNE